MITSFQDLGLEYKTKLNQVLEDADWAPIEKFAHSLLKTWQEGRQLFICGNGGSAGNAIHIANDFIYGISKKYGSALKVHALTANSSVMTCLANDEGYDKIFSYPLAVQANEGDVLLVLSGSGNSANILNVLRAAKEIGVESYAILGFGGGEAKAVVDTPIHFEINDMQISEDLQLIVCHMVMQWLYENREQVQ